MSRATWADWADHVLAPLFVVGRPAPSPEQLRAAYPFGPRAYHPYKVWLKRVRAFREAHAKSLPSPAPIEAAERRERAVRAARTAAETRLARTRDTETLDAFGSGGAS